MKKNKLKGLLLMTIGVVVFLSIMLVTSIDKHDKTPVWGKGELKPEFVEYFGDGNNARLNKAQNDAINKHSALLHGVDSKGVRHKGIIYIMKNLEARLKVLEAVDPNK